MAVLAIDQGATSTRAFLKRSAAPGEIVCTFEHQQYCPHPNWVEHNPEERISKSSAA